MIAASASWPVWPRVVLALLLLVSAARFPGLVRDFLVPAWPAIALWGDPAEQARRSTFTPYDLLQAADAALPRAATVLLVTSGRDVRLREYTAYHRALYYLAPRSVWWLAPAPQDGTWESRRWITRPVTADAIRGLAAEKGAGYVLLLDLAPPAGLGTVMLAREEGILLRLGGEEPPLGAVAGYASAWWPVPVALATAVALAAGALLLRAVARAGFRVTGVEAWALAWLLGMGSTTLALAGMSALGVRVGTQIVIWSGAVAVVWAVVSGASIVARARRRKFATYVSCLAPGGRECGEFPPLGTRRRSAAPSPPRPVQVGWSQGPWGNRCRCGRAAPTRVALTALLVAWLAIHVVFVALLALGRPLEFWDSWAVWGVKARAIWRAEGITPAVYGDPSRASTLPGYPLLVPLAETWTYGWLGAPDDRLAGVPAVGFYLALVALAYAAALRSGGRLTGLAAAAAVASLAPVTLGAAFVYADVPLAAYALGAGVFLRRWRAGGTRGALLLAALCAGLMPWTKREGWLLLLALGAAVFAVSGVRRGWRAALALGAGALVAAGPWALFAALRAAPDGVYLPPAPESLFANLQRVPIIAALALRELSSLWWGGLWIAAPLCVVATVRIARREALLPATAALYLALIVASYVLSDYVPYQQHVVSSLWRLASQVAPAVVVWLAAADQRP